jgi:hypothetical protein
MTLYEFNSLSFKDQYKTVIEYGTFLDNYVSNSERANCYALYKFFVEVIYDQDKNQVTEIKSFKTGYLLDKYSNLKL